ncbi:MAG: DMT family transporter, partial [Rhodospirillaceae bacterium]|nr:DMT family transporter [Rhodospirillaceae bacterium]
VILRPGIAAMDPAAFLVVLTALCFATSSIIVKTLSRTESPNAIVTWMVIYLAPISLVPALFVWQTPSLEMLPWLAAVGAATTLGHVGLTRAYNAADASYVQPFQYATLPFAALIGYFAFAEAPDVWTWVGAGIIAASALYIARRETLAVQDSTTPALPGDGSGTRPPRRRADHSAGPAP